MFKKKITLIYLLSIILSSCNKAPDLKREYIFNTYTSSKMTSLNNHKQLSDGDSYISSFLQAGLYSKVLSDDKSGYEYICDLASEKPQEVKTEELTSEEKEKYYSKVGNPASQSIYDIKLNKDAKFQDGKEIKAVDYITSFKDLLDPKYGNEKASLFITDYPILNAKEYNYQNRYVLTSLYDILLKDSDYAPRDGNYYLNIYKANQYISNLFSNNTEASLYDLIYLSTFDKTSTASLYGQRIIDATIYFLSYCFIVHYDSIRTDGTRRFEQEDEIDSYLKFYSENEDFFNENYSSWMRLVSLDEANFAENVTSKMLKNMPSINMVEFDNHTLIVRKEANNSVLDSNNSEVYSYSKLKDDMNSFVKNVASVSFTDPYKALLYVNYKDETTVSYDSVGLREIDEYTIRFYFKKSMNKDDVMNLLTYNFLVDIDLYDKLTSVNAITKITDYQSKTIENFNSYGPYKVDEIDEDKIILKRNGNYKIKRDDLYKTEEVVIYYIEDKNDANEKFFKGELDYLEYDDSLNSYSSSSLLSHTSSTEMERLVLNSDYDSLISREKDKNKNILSNINFRKAISLAINRSDYLDKMNIDGEPLSTLYTDSYIANNKEGTSYNYSTYGQSVKNSLNNSLSTNDYQISEKDNGYSFLLALNYMYEAILEELQSEKIASLKDGDTISLDVVIKNDEKTSSYTKKIDYLTQTLNTLLDSANNKLLLNGKLAYEDKIKLEINTVTTSDYDTKIKDNSFDIIFVTSTGNSSNPFSYIRNFASSSYSYCYEPGLKGKQNVEKIGVDLDDSGKIEDSEIQTYDYYVNMMNSTLDETSYSLVSRSDSEYSDYLTNHNKRLKILSAIEYNILSRYETIPLYCKTTSYFYSRKVSNYLDTYSPVFQFGGFKYLNYEYKEDEWQDYLDKYNHNLSNEYK